MSSDRVREALEAINHDTEPTGGPVIYTHVCTKTCRRCRLEAALAPSPVPVLSNQQDAAHWSGAGDCYLCHKRTNPYAGNPSEWPMELPYAGGNGKRRHYCMGCVIAACDATKPLVGQQDGQHLKLASQLAEVRQQARNWLQVHFPPGNLGFWNWQTVDSLAALVREKGQKEPSQSLLTAAEATQLDMAVRLGNVTVEPSQPTQAAWESWQEILGVLAQIPELKRQQRVMEAVSDIEAALRTSPSTVVDPSATDQPSATARDEVVVVGSPKNIRATWSRLASDVFDADGECDEEALDRLIAYAALRSPSTSPSPSFGPTYATTMATARRDKQIEAVTIMKLRKAFHEAGLHGHYNLIQRLFPEDETPVVSSDELNQRIRQWLLSGGGGFEGTTAASSFSFSGLIDFIAAWHEDAALAGQAAHSAGSEKGASSLPPQDGQQSGDRISIQLRKEAERRSAEALELHKALAKAQRLEMALIYLHGMFDDEGNLKEQYEDQLSVALEKAERALDEAGAKGAAVDPL